MRARIASILAFVTAVTFTGCSTAAPTSLAFRPEEGKAFLVVASAPTDIQAMHVFRKVNLATGKFEGDIIKITTGLYGGTGRLNGNDPSAPHPPSAYLAVTGAPPGDYAQVETSYTIVGYPVSRTLWHCFNEGAPVYSLKAGGITIVRADNVMPPEIAVAVRTSGNALGSVTDENVLEEFARARAAYPGIVGEATLGAPETVIRYEDAMPLIFQLDAIFTNVRECGQPAKFTAMR